MPAAGVRPAADRKILRDRQEGRISRSGLPVPFLVMVFLQRGAIIV